jgi:hypothetical protein
MQMSSNMRPGTPSATEHAMTMFSITNNAARVYLTRGARSYITYTARGITLDVSPACLMTTQLTSLCKKELDSE